VRHPDPRPAGAARSDDGEAARERVAAQVYAEPSGGRRSTNARIISIGAGKTIVDAFVAPISSSVCR